MILGLAMLLVAEPNNAKIALRAATLRTDNTNRLLYIRDGRVDISEADGRVAYPSYPN
jgi:hypothetical protein